MSDISHATVSAPDPKRRKLDPDIIPAHLKAERARAVVRDKAKANYLSGQLRLRLQYAKLKVEHGWQKQTLSEVENLYFRHTHLTRPYPIISPGGRRNGRTLSSNNLSVGVLQENVPSPTTAFREQSGSFSQSTLSASSSQHWTFTTQASSSSGDLSSSSSIPSTPVPAATRISTPLAPHVGFGSVTRYPISRTDSSQTLIAETTPSLYHGSPKKPSSSVHPHPSGSSCSQIANAFREPFDPMEPTDHTDSQLAALRSILSASSLPIPLPPPSPAAAVATTIPMQGPLTPISSNSGTGIPSSGLTYDAFWSAHGSSTASFRSLLTGQGPQSRPGGSLQPNANTGSGSGMGTSSRSMDDLPVAGIPG